MVHPPSGLTKGLDFLIACNWTPEQALAVVELLDDLREPILWHYQLPVTSYQLPIMALMREARGIGSLDDVDATDVARVNEQPF